MARDPSRHRAMDIALIAAAAVGAAMLSWSAVEWVDYTRFLWSVLR